MNDRYSNLAFLNRVKERKTPSLSAQASFAPFSLKVAWSGKSLIVPSSGYRVPVHVCAAGSLVSKHVLRLFHMHFDMGSKLNIYPYLFNCL